jgi:WD40 repeat protein
MYATTHRSKRAWMTLSLILCWSLCQPLPSAEPMPEASPIVLESRTRVRMMNWTGPGTELVFGGELQAGEPDCAIEASNLKSQKTNRIRGMEGADQFTVLPDGTVIFGERVAETRLELRFVNLKTGDKLKTLDFDVKHRLFAPRAMACSPDGMILVCAGLSGTPTIEPDSDNVESRILLVDLRTGTLQADLIEKDDVINAVAFSPDGALLVTGHNVVDKDKPGVKVWDIAKGTLIQAWPAKRQSVTGVAVSPDGKYVASVGFSHKLPKDGDDFMGWEWDHLVSLHDIQTGRLVQNFKGHTGSPYRVAFSRDGLLASGGADLRVRVWKAGSDEPLQTFDGHTAPVKAVTFAPDGKRLATGGMDKKVQIWNVASLK